MATITVTNTTAAPVYCSDLYATIPASGVVSTTRAPAQLEAMRGLQSLVAAGTCTLSVVYTADERASGMVPEGLTASGVSGLSDLLVFRFPITAGGGGSADDVTIYALNSLPFSKMRILDASAFISAGNTGGRTLQVRSATAGAGTLCAEVSAATAGRTSQTTTVTASQVLTNGSTVGLFVRRSDSAIAGEIQITLRPEV